MKFKAMHAVYAVMTILGITLLGMNVGINDAGQRQVIQYPNGTMTVKFEPGIYFPLFGKVTPYNDYLTFDFSPSDDTCEFLNNDGLPVRYQDGGEGVVCGMVNVQLPTDDGTMIKLHKRFRSEEGIRNKLLKQAVPKAMNLTAALMSSEESYASKRSEFIRMSREQTEKGLYKTKLIEKRVVVGVDENGKEETQLKEVPEIVFDSNKQAITTGSDLDLYGFTVSQFDLKAWDFEPKTIKQIQDKRAAEMAIVTAKANAKKAYWEEQQVRAEGEKNVSTAEYEARVAAERQIQEAERDKQLAVIEATKQKEKATELTLAAKEATKQKTEELLAARKEAEIITTLANANAYRIQKEQEAGELKLRLDNSVQIAEKYAGAIERMNVPNTMLIGTGGGAKDGSTEIQQLLQIQVLKALGGITPEVGKTR